jgi:hypothetical protein
MFSQSMEIFQSRSGLADPRGGDGTISSITSWAIIIAEFRYRLKRRIADHLSALDTRPNYLYAL